MDGCYFHFNKIRKEWIHSGKVHDRPSGERINDHNTGAKLLTADSKYNLFYRSYPKGKMEKRKKGTQDWIVVYVVFGYNRIKNPKDVDLIHDFFK